MWSRSGLVLECLNNRYHLDLLELGVYAVEVHDECRLFFSLTQHHNFFFWGGGQVNVLLVTHDPVWRDQFAHCRHNGNDISKSLL